MFTETVAYLVLWLSFVLQIADVAWLLEWPRSGAQSRRSAILSTPVSLSFLGFLAILEAPCALPGQYNVMVGPTIALDNRRAL